MKAIIIAAGMGKRLGVLTNQLPKCLLQTGNTTLLENIITNLYASGVSDIGIIVGHQQDKIRNKLKNVHFFVNDNYVHNNILHSLMYAKDFMNDDLIISYSDIWLEQSPVKQLASHPGDCVISVDEDWQKNYINRTDHPLSEAENVIYTDERALKLGKHLSTIPLQPNQKCSEFIGLSKISKSFCKTFIQTFEACNAKLSALTPFQNSKTWHNAYLTDFFNELIDRDHPVHCSTHQGGWREIDTQQDYHKLQLDIAETLHVI